MTRQTVGSFLVRIEAADDGRRTGTVTSVQSGDHTPFGSVSELAQILERWAGPGGAPKKTEEDLA
jgi:hypothetical protein